MNAIVLYSLLIFGVILPLCTKSNPVPAGPILCFQTHTPNNGNFGKCNTSQPIQNPNRQDGRPEHEFQSAADCCAQAGAAGYTPNRSGSRCSPCSSLVEEEAPGENEGATVDGSWSAWDRWSECSVTCDIGEKTRTRTCTNPAPQNGGADCDGDSTKTKPCDEGSCIVDGNWGAWGEYGECSATCGLSATQSRRRECNNPAPMNGGSDCEGDPEDNRRCEGLPPCPIDGVWSAWGQWSSCSATCGDGQKQRARFCNNPAAQHGGQECQGEPRQTKQCRITACPIHGGWSEWGDWQACSASKCNETGLRLRSHSCTNPRPRNGGRYCRGPVYSSMRCTNTDACPVDGMWGEWGDWSECSGTCGSVRERQRVRSCDNPEPRNGGVYCIGRKQDLEGCEALPPCPTEMPSRGCDDEDTDCEGSGSGSGSGSTELPTTVMPTENPCSCLTNQYYYDQCNQGILDVLDVPDIPGNECVQPTEKIHVVTQENPGAGGGNGEDNNNDNLDYSISSY